MRRLRSLAWPVLVLVSIVLWSVAVGRSIEVERQKSRKEISAFKSELVRLEYDNAILTSEHTRLSAIVTFSAEHKIDAGLAAMIYDVALAEGISPDIAFRMVQVESNFEPRAISRKGAIGYAQVMPSTASTLLGRSVGADELFDPRLNLHLGFSYLRQLLFEYNGDLRLALLAYNRGPRRVNELLALGQDPSNGYARDICGDCRMSE